MTNFEDFNIILELLVQYVFGSYPIFATIVIALFLITILMKGIDLRFAIMFAIPLVGAFVYTGWFGINETYQWIVNLFLIVGSMIYATAIIKLTT